MVDIKKLQSLLFEEDADEEEEVNYTSEQPLAHENTTQITIDPAVFAEPEEEPEEPEFPADPEFPEEPVYEEPVYEEPAYEEPAYADEEEIAEEPEQPTLFDELTAESAAEIEEPLTEPEEDVLPEVTEEVTDGEELPVFEEIIEDEPAPEPSIEEKIDAIVFGDHDGFSDIDDLFAEFAAATDLDAVEEPEPEPEEIVLDVETEPEEAPAEEEVILRDVPVSEEEDVPEETAETTNIVDFFSDIAGEDIPENVANEKTAALDLDAILNAPAEPAYEEEAEQPEEAPAAEEDEEVDFFEEKLTIEEEPAKPAKKEKEFVYHFQPIISPLFGTDLSESQTTKKSGEDRQIIVTSNLEVHDDAPTEILDTRSLKDDEE